MNFPLSRKQQLIQYYHEEAHRYVADLKEYEKLKFEVDNNAEAQEYDDLIHVAQTILHWIYTTQLGVPKEEFLPK